MISKHSTCVESPEARLAALIEELSHFGLGAFQPHRHSASGRLTALPPGEIALERGLQVSFVTTAEALNDAVPVGWRWNGTAVEVCAACCDKNKPPPELQPAHSRPEA